MTQPDWSGDGAAPGNQAITPNLSNEEESEDGAKDEDSNEEQGDKGKTESSSKVKFTDPDPAENPEDYIVFSKFGLEAPLIDDFNDFRPDGKILLHMDSDQKEKSLEREKKLKDEIDKKNKEIALKENLLKNKKEKISQDLRF